MVRLWQPRETRLLSEWISKNYPDDRVMYRVRLGRLPMWAREPVLKGVPPELYKIYQRWADAIIIRKTELILIEAKINPDPGAISQINLYAQLLPKTEELSEYWDLPIKKVILMAIKDTEIEELAAADNITVITYTPTWAIDYLKECRKYRERYS